MNLALPDSIFVFLCQHGQVATYVVLDLARPISLLTLAPTASTGMMRARPASADPLCLPHGIRVSVRQFLLPAPSAPESTPRPRADPVPIRRQAQRRLALIGISTYTSAAAFMVNGSCGPSNLMATSSHSGRIRSP